MNVAAPYLCPYSIKPSRDDGERGVLAVTAFKIAGREIPLHQESAAQGRSRATRKEVASRTCLARLLPRNALGSGDPNSTVAASSSWPNVPQTPRIRPARKLRADDASLRAWEAQHGFKLVRAGA